jgi:hypothetical protein
MEQVENLDAVLVPIGGGGLAAGVATWVNYVNPKCRGGILLMIACLPSIPQGIYTETVFYSSVLCRTSRQGAAAVAARRSTDVD